ncbi:MAG TPA: hypothetical protein VNS09_26315 [Solirubrobacter sp.]|nr:hypothetical protein [Solirubrobacter sp.]
MSGAWRMRRAVAVPALVLGGLIVVATNLAALAAGLYYEWTGLKMILDGDVIEGVVVMGFVAMVAASVVGLLALPGAGLLRLGEVIWTDRPSRPPASMSAKVPVDSAAHGSQADAATRIDEDENAGTSTSPKRGPWLQWGRWVALGLCLLAGAAGGWDPENWVDTPAFGPVSGVVSTFAVIYLYGLVAWVVIRWIFRRRSWNYLRATYSPLVLSLVFLGVLGMPALRHRDRTTSPSAHELERATDTAIASSPDPVGMKLAGQSDQLSDRDARLLDQHGSLGNRFSTTVTRVIDDYGDTKIGYSEWIASSKQRLRNADRALSAMRNRTADITDSDVQVQLRRLDKARTGIHTALSRLLGVVRDGQADSEPRIQRLVDRRVAAYQRVTRDLRTLMEPYLSDEQKEQLGRPQQGGGS